MAWREDLPNCSYVSEAGVDISVTNANKSKLSTDIVKGEYNALEEVEDAKFKELVVLKYGISPYQRKRQYQPGF